MIFVLVVSHDANLYGADKSLIGALWAMKDDDISPIVALPRMGPLVDLLRGENFEVHIGAVGRLKRAQLSIGSLPKMVREVRESLRFFDSIVANRKLGLVYINTVATVGGAVWARLRGIPVLWSTRLNSSAAKAISAGPCILGLTM